MGMSLKEKLDTKVEMLKEISARVEKADADKEQYIKKIDGERNQLIQEMLRLDGECRLLDEMVKDEAATKAIEKKDSAKK